MVFEWSREETILEELEERFADFVDGPHVKVEMAEPAEPVEVVEPVRKRKRWREQV
jgi:hypothetical protein